MHELAGKYLKYNKKQGDSSWDVGHIYKVAEDGSIKFGDKYSHRCDYSTLKNYLISFDEVSKEEYNIQQGITIGEPLIFN